MKKSIIAVFSVSLTAGTLYLSYSQLKSYLIKKLVTSWELELEKQQKNLQPEQLERLKEELDKLFIWEVKWLSAYTTRVFGKATEKDITPYLKKIVDKKIRERIDLKAVDVLLFGA